MKSTGPLEAAFKVSTLYFRDALVCGSCADTRELRILDLPLPGARLRGRMLPAGRVPVPARPAPRAPSPSPPSWNFPPQGTDGTPEPARTGHRPTPGSPQCPRSQRLQTRSEREAGSAYAPTTTDARGPGGTSVASCGGQSAQLCSTLMIFW